MSTADALSRWAAKGDREVTLPTGTRVKVRVPPVEQLIRDKGMPTELRGMVLQFATTGFDTEKLDAEGLEHLLTLQALLASRTIRALWNDETEQWDEVRLTPDQLDELGLPSEDLTAIEHIALRRATPNQITVHAKRDLGLVAPEEAEVVQQEEAGGTVDAFGPFRDQSGGAGAGAAGAAVGAAAQRDAGHSGPGAGARA